MYEASKIGCITGQFSELYRDELDDYEIKHKSIDDVLKKGYFIRCNKTSLKFGQHGTGPYYIKQIIESLTTSRLGHQEIAQDTKEIMIYLIEFTKIHSDKEFRIFVYENNITAISQQNIYSINDSLVNNRSHITNWVTIMKTYFELKLNLI